MSVKVESVTRHIMRDGQTTQPAREATPGKYLVQRCKPADYEQVVKICADAFPVGLLGSERDSVSRAVSCIDIEYVRRYSDGMLERLQRLQERKRKAKVWCLLSL
jgi:hypothetical protein